MGELALLVTDLPDSAALGESLAARVSARQTGTPPQPTTTRDLLHHIEQFAGKSVWIEEQDHADYIIHFDSVRLRTGDDPEVGKWIIVNSDSPLFTALRERHHRARRRQPWVF